MTLFYMATAWAVGIVLAERGTFWPAMPAVMSLVGLLWGLAWSLAPLHRNGLTPAMLRRAGWCALAAGLGMARLQAAQPQLTPDDLATHNDRGMAELIGVVIDDPDVRDQSTRLRVEVESLRFTSAPAAGPAQPVRGLALVYAGRSGAFAYGDRVRIYGQPQTPPEFDTFSFRDYLARRGVYTLVRNARVSVLAHNRGSSILAASFTIRTHARALIARLLPDPQAALLAGILLGDERGIAPEIQDAFRLTNTSHLIAISGANVAVIVALLLALFQRLPGRLSGKWPSTFLTIAGVFAYAIFVGASPSVVRAAIMASMSLIAQRVGRRSDGLTALAASAWLMTALNPLALFDLGLILSVAATLGLVLYLAPLTRFAEQQIAHLFAASTARRISAVLADSVLITLTAQVTTLPIILLISQQFSPFSLLVNVLVAPAQAWIMSLGLLTVIAGSLWLPVGQIAAWLVGLPLSYTLAIIRTAAALPGSGAPVAIEAAPVLGYYAALLAATAVASQHTEVRQRFIVWLRARAAVPAVGMIGLAIAGLVWSVALARPDGLLRLWFLAVGEGNAILIQTPDGAHLLIDGGENPTRLQTALGDHLPFFKRRLDALIITEPKATTIAALPPLLARYQVGAVITNGQKGDTQAFRALDRALQGLSVPILSIAAGYRAQFSDGVTLETLYPPQTPAANAESDDVPLILLLTYGDATFLLMSDVSERAMQRFAPVAPRATVLQLPSNGAARSNPPEWLAATAPQVAIIVAEAGNARAQPAQSVIDVLTKLKVATFRTDQHGSIEIATDGRQLWIRSSRNWQGSPQDGGKS